jgi:hypothetical protein
LHHDTLCITVITRVITVTLFPFRWTVSKQPYFWDLPVSDRTLPEPRRGEGPLRAAFLRRQEAIPAISDGVPVARSSELHARTYAPLIDETGLFRSFADTSADADGVLAFTSRYGLLGVSPVAVTSPTVLPVRAGSREVKATLAAGELLTAWQAEIAAMREFVTLWDLIEANDTGALATFIRWNELGVFYVTAAGTDLIAQSPTRYKSGDVIGPARAIVLREINRRLDGLVSPRVLIDVESSERGLYFVPQSLIGALWLQFARAVAEKNEFRRCRACRKWFEVSLDAHVTVRRLYCHGDNCRAAAYRQRKADARQMYADGVRVPEIAKRLGTTSATVKTWIKRK